MNGVLSWLRLGAELVAAGFLAIALLAMGWDLFAPEAEGAPPSAAAASASDGHTVQ